MKNQSLGEFCEWNWGEWLSTSSYVIAALTMITPLIITIVVYTAIIYRISMSPKLRALNSTMITIRAMIMCTFFSISWIPSQVVRVVPKLAKNASYMNMVQTVLYINCLTDPLIYTFTPSTLSLCVSRVRHGLTVTLSEVPTAQRSRNARREENVELYQNNNAAAEISARHELSAHSPEDSPEVTSHSQVRTMSSSPY